MATTVGGISTALAGYTSSAEKRTGELLHHLWALLQLAGLQTLILLVPRGTCFDSVKPCLCLQVDERSHRIQVSSSQSSCCPLLCSWSSTQCSPSTTDPDTCSANRFDIPESPVQLCRLLKLTLCLAEQIVSHTAVNKTFDVQMGFYQDMYGPVIIACLITLVLVAILVLAAIDLANAGLWEATLHSCVAWSHRSFNQFFAFWLSFWVGGFFPGIVMLAKFNMTFLFWALLHTLDGYASSSTRQVSSTIGHSEPLENYFSKPFYYKGAPLIFSSVYLSAQHLSRRLKYTSCSCRHYVPQDLSCKSCYNSAGVLDKAW